MAPIRKNEAAAWKRGFIIHVSWPYCHTFASLFLTWPLNHIKPPWDMYEEWSTDRFSWRVINPALLLVWNYRRLYQCLQVNISFSVMEWIYAWGWIWPTYWVYWYHFTAIFYIELQDSHDFDKSSIWHLFHYSHGIQLASFAVQVTKQSLTYDGFW